MLLLFRPVAFLLTLVALSGCAAGHSGSLAGRFIRPGKPSIDFGGPPIPTAEAVQTQIRQVRHVSAAATSNRSTMGSTLESTDSELAMALLLEAILPTAENQLRVAEEYRRLGVLDTAYAHVNSALAKDPKFAAAYEMTARIWRDWGLPAEGLGSAYRATYFAPRSSSAHNTLGTLLAALGKTAEARRAYRQALALDDTAAYAHNNLCYLEFRAAHFAEAQTECEAALRLAPNLTAAHNNLGLTYAATGRIDDARQEFLAGGDAATAAYNVGIVRLAAGDFAKAADAFEEAIDERPTYTAAKTRAHQARVRALGQRARPIDPGRAHDH